jgi:hypothetical protein
MPKTLLDFANECGRYGANHALAQRIALKLAAQATEVGIERSAQSRGWPTKGSGMGPFGFTSRFLGADVAEVKVRGGAAYAFEFGAGRHLIFPSKTRLRRGTRRREPLSYGARALATPYGPKAYVEHPGFRGRPYFTTGLRLAEPAVIKAMEGAVVNAMRRTFR